MNEQLVTQLEELGLSQKEARVYVASLMLGPSTVQKIADFSGIKRVTTYVILESLVNLGLASQSTKGKKTFFTAEEPTNLRRLLTKKEEQLKEQKHGFEEILPDLQALKTMPTDTPSVKFYDTAEGIKSILNTFMGSGKDANVKEVYGISNLDQLYAYFPEFKISSGNPERHRSGIKSRFIYTTTEGPILASKDEGVLRTSRFLPHDKYDLNADLSIVGDNIVMLSLTGAKPLGITINSRELAKSMKAIFEVLWDAAEQYNK